MILLDGKATATQARQEIKQRAIEFEQKANRKVGLAVVLCGEDPASQVYVRNKVKACEEAGILSSVFTLPETATQREAEEIVKSLAEDEKTDGILVQLPLPSQLNEEKLLKLIPPEKDVDGFSAVNMGKLTLNEKDGSVSCTPLGVMRLLEKYRIPVAGKHAVVVGRSNIVGRPMAMLLLNADATVTICHSKTKNLKEECLRADILVAAIGKPKAITADMVKEGAVVIDVGINRVDGKLFGDVDFETVKQKASYITPVPGGVGPMTIAMLLENVCNAAERTLTK